MNRTDLSTEVVEVLCRRGDLASQLLEEPQDKRTLVERTDIPRSTLDRAVRELELADIAAYRNGQYTVTPTGARLVRAFERFRDQTELVLNLAPFLRWVPADEFDLDLDLLRDATLVAPESGNPYATVDRQVERLADADHVRGLLPQTGLHAYQTTHERIVDHGATVDLVVERSVATVMLSDPAFEDLTDRLLATGRFGLHVYDDTIPYSVLSIDDDLVQVCVTEDGDPRALLETDNPTVTQWAHGTIDAYRTQSTPVEDTALADRPRGR